jgi:Holliday junction resolvase RusA-like endonuclease
MLLIEFVVAGKPLAKGRVRFTKTGHAFTPERTVHYEGQLAHAAALAMDGRPPVEGPVAVTLEVHMPIAASWPAKKRQAALCGALRPTGRPDLDNFAKMLDALNLIVWNDDSQIVELCVFKRYSLQPQMAITVDTLDSNGIAG